MLLFSSDLPDSSNALDHEIYESVKHQQTSVVVAKINYT